MITLVEDTYEAKSRAQLIAVIQAGAQPTYEAALAHPFTVALGRTTYSFPRGCTQQRANKIATAAKRYPTQAFKVAP